MIIGPRAASIDDVEMILELYREVASGSVGLAREAHEITHEFVRGRIERALSSGVALVVDGDDGIIGEVHAFTEGIDVFSHVLGHLTMAVHPSFQGDGIGRSLLSALIDDVSTRLPHILRIELITRESNLVARRLYRSLGFVEEGRMEMRIRGADGRYEADVPMAWIRP